MWKNPINNDFKKNTEKYIYGLTCNKDKETYPKHLESKVLLTDCVFQTSPRMLDNLKRATNIDVSVHSMNACFIHLPFPLKNVSGLQCLL